MNHTYAWIEILFRHLPADPEEHFWPKSISFMKTIFIDKGNRTVNAQRKNDEREHNMRSRPSRSTVLIYGDALSECLKRAYAGTNEQDDDKEFDALLGKLDDIKVTK